VVENELWTVGERTTADELLTAFLLALLLKMGARVLEDGGEDDEEFCQDIEGTKLLGDGKTLLAGGP